MLTGQSTQKWQDWPLSVKIEFLKRLKAKANLAERQSNYKARGAALRLQDDQSSELVISGPSGTGKSRAALEKMVRAAANYKGFRGLLCRKTRTSLTDSGLVTLERDVLGLNHPLVVNGPTRRFRHTYVFPGGGEIVVGGLDKPGRMFSTEYDLIIVQQAEECALKDWETLITRCRNFCYPYQQLIGDVNPGAPTHWLKQRGDAGVATWLESRHGDNPVLWDDVRDTWTARGLDYIAKLDRLTGARLQRLRFGRWVQAEGVVFEGWDSALHVIDRFEIPEDWRRFRVVDFGYTNPFVCQWWAVDGDGRMYLYREIYHTGRTVRTHAQQINALSAGERVVATICDHDAEDRATLEENGIVTEAAKKAVSVGLQRMQERLKIAGDGRARLFYLRDSLVELDLFLIEELHPTCTPQEYDGYIWSNNKRKEEPVKAHDHGVDATRYGVMYQDEYTAPVGVQVEVDLNTYKPAKRERLLGG